MIEDKEIKIKLNEGIEAPKTSTDNFDQLDLKEQTKERFSKDTKLRNNLSWWVIAVDSLWLLCVIILLFLNSCCIRLSDSVLMVLLGTTTANVLGLAFIVLKGMFPTK